MAQLRKGTRRHLPPRGIILRRSCWWAGAMLLLLAPLSGLAVPARSEGLVVPPPPVDLDVGFDMRIREVTAHNLLDLNSAEDFGPPSDTHFFRVRHRLSVKLKLRSGINLCSRFTTEWRKYLDPFASPEKTEIIVDNIYIDVPSLPFLPLSLRVGRQDIARGEGFILLDGGPGDGSRSIYQNAVMLGVDSEVLGLGKSAIELFVIRNPAWDEFVVTNDRRGKMVEKDETAFGIYVTHPGFGQSTETYYFYKEEEPESRAHPDARVHTVGTRVSGELPWDVGYAAEGAWQAGSQDDPQTGKKICDHHAYGAHGWFSRSFLALFRPTLKIGGIILSGDDPDTDELEDWNPLFSRWPKWSELYIYTLIPESNRTLDPENDRVAYWTNLASLNAQIGLVLAKDIELTYTFHRLWARHARPAALDRLGLFGEGRDRGELHEWRFSCSFSKFVTGHLLIERLAPGDFYRVPRDDAYFIRWELMVKT